jgi:hypothetical protein
MREGAKIVAAHSAASGEAETMLKGLARIPPTPAHRRLSLLSKIDQ